METIIKAAVLSALISCSSICLAESKWEANVGYLDIDGGVAHSHLGAVTLGAGREFSLNDAFSIIPSVEFGIGAKKGSTPIRIGVIEEDNPIPVTVVENYDAELEHYHDIAIKFKWQMSDHFYAHLTPSHVNIAINVSDPTNTGQRSYFDKYSGLGVSLGAGYKFNKRFSIEGTYRKLNLDLREGDTGVTLRAVFKI